MKHAATRTGPILLVEDNIVNKTVKATLERTLGLPVHIAETVAGALELLRQRGPFAVIIVDIMMQPADFPGEAAADPLEAGYQLARNIRAGKIDASLTPSDVPILFYTGVASTSLIKDIKNGFGEDNVFLKPCSPEVLLRRIREIFRARPLARATARTTAACCDQT